jgi:cation transport regulator ChaC
VKARPLRFGSKSDSYAGRLFRTEVVLRVAKARGNLGLNKTYLLDTV